MEARRQLDEELALLHQELGMDVEPRDRRPAQDFPCMRSPVKGMASGASAVRLPSVDGPYNKLLTVNISATVAIYNEFHACFRC
jgi:hypothetical protein